MEKLQQRVQDILLHTRSNRCRYQSHLATAVLQEVKHVKLQTRARFSHCPSFKDFDYHKKASYISLIRYTSTSYIYIYHKSYIYIYICVRKLLCTHPPPCTRFVVCFSWHDRQGFIFIHSIYHRPLDARQGHCTDFLGPLKLVGPKTAKHQSETCQ